MITPEQPPHLTAIETPDMADVTRRFMALRDDARIAETRVVIGGLCAEFTNDEIHLLAEHRAACDEIVNRAELESLRRWKAEATTVLSEWEQVWEALGRPGRLGESKAHAVRRALGETL